MSSKLDPEDLDTIEVIARNGQTGRITPYEVRELLCGYRAYIASQDAAAPSEEPVATQVEGGWVDSRGNLFLSKDAAEDSNRSKAPVRYQIKEQSDV